MKQSSKCAIGGIVSALSLVLMISVAIIPFLTYALPAVASVLIAFLVIEVDKKWAFGVYCTVSILSFLLVGDKEVAMMYIAFFGYYPILKAVFESRLHPVIGWILKLIIFNASIAAAYVIMINLMGVTVDEINEYGAIAIPVLLGAATVAFVMFDIALTKMVTLYVMKWQKLFKRYFK